MEMISKLNKHLLIAAAALSVLTVNAREKNGSVFKHSAVSKVTAGCSAAQSSAELAVNNVRTIIYSGSDMWWDLFGSGNAWYAIPKVENKANFINSNFSGNVWLGGLDQGGQLKIAAQTYRQQGVDFWSGPLSTIDASVSSDVCSKYDKIFRITRAEVDAFALPGGTGVLTDNIKNWPGNGDISLNQDYELAPYVDIDKSGNYNPEAGDYPYYDIFNNAGKDPVDGTCRARVFGDETLWWVYNDNGDVHVATGGRAIGLEVRAQAFAFKTTNEINNMTFYNYQLINRSSFKLVNTYMTVWTDADLGYYGDDFIGCDVQRGLGYIYNGDPFDETATGTNGYGAYIPSLGCDFFQGPINRTNGIDDDHDGAVDEAGEQMGMTKFLYFNNSFPGFNLNTTDPSTAVQYYQYMTGFWKDGSPFTCDVANGYGGAIPTSFMYPADTYTNNPCGIAGAYNQETLQPGDRRFMQSSGPFELLPGATNYVTFGLPWARTTSAGSPKSSIALLKIADDKAQALFDDCFKVLSGPEAPDMTIQELNNELILYFTNKPSSNNFLNQYAEKDASIKVDPTHYGSVTGVGSATTSVVDNFYRFEGFKVYQLRSESVTQEDLDDQSKAKLVFSCDVANGVKRLINFEYDATTGGDIPRVKAEGTDIGLQSTFHFNQDQFSTSSDKKVINNKTYYFYAVAYAYNQYGEYIEDKPWTSFNTASSEGQKLPYLEGRLSKKAYGIPHPADPEKEGSIANSAYGYGPKIQRIEGQGNGGNALELTEESVNAILSNGDRVNTITYENGRGPITVKVVDPLNVPNSTFSFEFVNQNWDPRPDTVASDPCRLSEFHKNKAYSKLKVRNTDFGKVRADSATWILKDLSSNKTYIPCKSIKLGEEFYFSELGMSVKVGQSRDVAESAVVTNTLTDAVVNTGDFISGTMSFSDQAVNWLSGVPDRDGTDDFNWIRSGTYKRPPTDNDPNHNDYQNTSLEFADPEGVFESVLGGTWAPYCLSAATKTTSIATFGAPAYQNLITGAVTTGASGSTQAKINPPFDLRTLASVDIILTKDKTKWTRSIVLEECDEQNSNPSKARKLEPRRSRSVDKQGIPLGAPGCNTAEASVDSIPGSAFQYGLSWFPGYAINLETGERLNIAFGEDSYQGIENGVAPNNGNDMMWNPTNNVSNNSYRYAFGGRHYIYVFGHNRSTSTYSGSSMSGFNGRVLGVGTYSKFADLAFIYKQAFAPSNATYQDNILKNIWSEAMWVNMPVTSEARYNFINPADMPCDAKVSLRVKKSYKVGYSGAFFVNSVGVVAGTNIYAPIYPGTANAYTQITRDTLTGSSNNNFGLYKFSTADIFSEINNAEKAKSALDLINVVPNPYYAYSTYETNRVDNRIRITNLPNQCRIKIFTLNGTLVRTFNRDVSGQEDVNETSSSSFVHSKRLSYQDWDLKNQSGISVASGLYIIYIDVPGVGEKILKWFGVMRPLDLQSY